MTVKNRPSDASNPDLDWSQVRETVMMLNVALSQVERSMTEGDESINALTRVFTVMAGKIKEIDQASDILKDSQEKKAIRTNCQDIAEMVDDAIVAFQFYDRLIQRLSHVGLNLSALSDLINDRQRLYSPHEWHGLQEMIKSKYYIDADRQMFNAILNGASVEEALDVGERHRRQEKDKNTVEVF
jgi:hypothetical protein